MSVTPSQIIFLVQRDQILIEITGLGHPGEVVKTLYQESCCEHLLIQRIRALNDPRWIEQSHVSQHSNFPQQIDVADIVMANKPVLFGVEQ